MLHSQALYKKESPKLKDLEKIKDMEINNEYGTINTPHSGAICHMHPIYYVCLLF